MSTLTPTGGKRTPRRHKGQTLTAAQKHVALGNDVADMLSKTGAEGEDALVAERVARDARETR